MTRPRLERAILWAMAFWLIAVCLGEVRAQGKTRTEYSMDATMIDLSHSPFSVRRMVRRTWRLDGTAPTRNPTGSTIALAANMML